MVRLWLPHSEKNPALEPDLEGLEPITQIFQTLRPFNVTLQEEAVGSHDVRSKEMSVLWLKGTQEVSEVGSELGAHHSYQF